jgi:hypothetical protein
MSKRNQTPEHIKDQPTSNQPINIQLSQKLYVGNPPLIPTVDVPLHTQPYTLHDLIHHSDDPPGVVSLQVVDEHGEEGDVRVFDLVRLGEHLVEGAERGRVVPVELAEELEDLVDGLFGEDVVD